MGNCVAHVPPHTPRHALAAVVWPRRAAGTVEWCRPGAALPRSSRSLSRPHRMLCYRCRAAQPLLVLLLLLSIVGIIIVVLLLLLLLLQFP